MAGDDEWLVSDSEDEDAFTLGGIGFGDSAGPTHSTDNLKSNETATIQTAVFSPENSHTPQGGRQSPHAADVSLFTPPQGEADSIIDDFTTIPSPSRVPEVLAPRPRPRPRVVTKQTKTSGDTANVASTSFSHISDSSAARDAGESIWPATTTSFGFPETTSDMHSSLGIADRAKMRARKPYTAKKPLYRLADDVEVIELTSDDDEIALKPQKRQKKKDKPPPKPKVQPKPRPKPTLKVKAAALPPGPQSNGTAVLGPPAPSAKPASSSQSTIPSIPPSIPAQAPEHTPPSSPMIITRKRKRIRSFIPDDDVDMDVGGELPKEASPPIPEPPSFFAPSSSSMPVSDSGVKVPSPIGRSSDGGKNNQVPPSKQKRAQTKTRSKGKKGNGNQLDGDRATEELGQIAQEPFVSATLDGSEFVEEQVSSVSVKTTKTKLTAKKKGKLKAIISDEEDEAIALPMPGTSSPQLRHFGTGAADTPATDEGEADRSKVYRMSFQITSLRHASQENLPLGDRSPPKRDLPPQATPASACQPRGFFVKSKPTPMSELIRRVNSQPSSPFPNASRSYSPFLKSSRTMLKRIAPLHPNRRTPPPPLPRPPPPKKSKKQLAMEENIEEELAEAVEGWSCMTDEERRALRRARIDAELGYE
ncbi:hypothetical protein PAXRUDRAFT_8782 [Paxillus rubicundulus Ve08.2h10]|uniref:Uncharacterized protein n=1 Tax=Paxillus rubicundulus Ve08.2h10 TaxID=930991 RepID=A0A0D0E9N4_9AGAM|nr:hypothetical protein PAXRUDRAFT_8782 [Paxillus rubicundulus Ve08.2h10]